jgi:hypothetical protein
LTVGGVTRIVKDASRIVEGHAVTIEGESNIKRVMGIVEGTMIVKGV